MTDLNYTMNHRDTPQFVFGDEVFIVHGHDDEAKETVARFVENFGIEATILHEKANRGQTIPEKFEEHASEAGFAIILLTPPTMSVHHKIKQRISNLVHVRTLFWS